MMAWSGATVYWLMQGPCWVAKLTVAGKRRNGMHCSSHEMNNKLLGPVEHFAAIMILGWMDE